MGPLKMSIFQLNKLKTVLNQHITQNKQYRIVWEREEGRGSVGDTTSLRDISYNMACSFWSPETIYLACW